MQFVLVFVSFVFLPSALSEASFSISETIDANEQLHDVTKWEQLWRFQVGNGKYLTIGDRYICLATRDHYFLRASGSSLCTSRHRCDDSGRFRVEFLEGNRVRLKLFEEEAYISCSQTGAIFFTDWKTSASVFELSINDAEDTVVFYNPSVMGALSTTGYKADCSGFRSGKSSKFYGWKEGPKKAWEASDEWQMIGYFDNRFSDSTTKFTYETAVGIEESPTSEATVAPQLYYEAGPDMFKAFTKSIGDSEVEWRWTPPNVWEEATRLSNSIDVAPRKLTKLYQAVGHYGVFTIRSLYFQARDEKDRILNLE